MALKVETAKDQELSAPHKLISEGWFPKRSRVPIPFIIQSDNGPATPHKNSRHSSKTYMSHIILAHYLQFNGMMESVIKVPKNVIEKAIQSDKP